VLGGGLVFARHQDGSVHALAPKLDRELWQVPLAQSMHPGTTCGDIFVAVSGQEVVAITGGAVLWRKDVGADVEMTPAVDGKRVFVGTAAGRVVALEAASGDEVWSKDVGAEFGSSDPVVDRGLLFLADRGMRDGRRGALNAFATADGALRWQTVFGATGFAVPFPDGDSVWGGFGVTVARFDRTTGAIDSEHQIRTGRNPFGRPGRVDDAVVFGNLDGSFYVHDRATGALRWRFDAGEKQQVGTWQLHEGVLLVGTTRGLFALVDEPGKAPAPAGFVLRAPSQGTGQGAGAGRPAK
jgi:outer membrane protein assembly factor BamB